MTNLETISILLLAAGLLMWFVGFTGDSLTSTIIGSFLFICGSTASAVSKYNTKNIQTSTLTTPVELLEVEQTTQRNVTQQEILDLKIKLIELESQLK